MEDEKEVDDIRYMQRNRPRPIKELKEEFEDEKERIYESKSK